MRDGVAAEGDLGTGERLLLGQCVSEDVSESMTFVSKRAGGITPRLVLLTGEGLTEFVLHYPPL